MIARVCAQYFLNLLFPDVCEWLLAEPPPECGEVAPAERIFPHRIAPVLVSRDGRRLLLPMSFSLIPSWSKERRPKFATYNARIETVATKAAWKEPFARRRCLVPLSGFVEASRHGEHAGHMLRLVSENGPMLAAGIYDSWEDPSSGDVVMSFAILTEAAPSSVLEIGHDRCPIFVRDDAASAWLDERPRDPGYLRDLLVRVKDDLVFRVERERPLKAARKVEQPRTGRLL